MEPKHRRILFFSLFVFLTVFFLANLGGIVGALGFALDVIMPILVGFAIAFVLNLPLRFLERRWRRIPWRGWQRVRRPICLLLTVLFALGVAVLLLVAVLPRLIETLSELLRNLPEEVGRLEGLWEAVRAFASGMSLTLPPLHTDHERIAAFLSGLVEKYGYKLMEISLDVMLTAFGTVFDTVVATVLSVYVLAKKERIGAQVTKFLRAVCSDSRAEGILRVASLTSRTFGKFLTGQLTEAVILGVLCFAGMLVFRMPFALLISVLVGVTALIPIFGAFIGIGAGAVLILSVEPMRALWFVIFVIVLQQLEGNLIYPRVVGKSVGLPGVWVLMAVTVGSSFGIAGMLLSVPLCSVLYSLARDFTEKRLRKRERGE